MRLFKRQYFVSISLFSALELAPKARVDYWRRNIAATYAIRCGTNGGYKHLGWAFVSPHASATAAWNERMRDKSLTFSTWVDGRLYDWWPEGVVPDPKTLNDVQLTVVYETLEKYEREAANAAWAKLLAGYPAYVEWYDASTDRRWTKLFRPRA